MTPRIETEALQALEKLRSEVTDEDLHESGRYFADCCCDMTQCRHGETGEYRNCADGRAIAILWSLWRSGVIHRNAAELLELRAIRDAVSPAIGSMYQSAKATFDEYELTIDHLNDLIAHFAAQAEHWRACAVGHLPQINGLKAEIKRLEAEIERQREYIAGRVYDC